MFGLEDGWQQRLPALSQRERWLWVGGILIWFVADLAITYFKASRGLIGWAEVVLAIETATGVPPFGLFAAGKFASLGLAGVAFALIDWEFRFLIPAGYVFIGLLTIAADLQLIRTIVF